MLDPNQRPRGLPLISGDGAYAYRLCRLARHWNENLSSQSNLYNFITPSPNGYLVTLG